MISQSAVLAMTPIAMALTERGIDLAENVSDVIKGLNDCTSNLVGFTPDNIATDLPEYTREVKEHSDVQALVFPKLAEVLRGSMYVISRQIKPILTEADQLIRQQLSADNAQDAMQNYLRIDMTNLEPEFLNSALCPTEMPETIAAAPTFDLSKMVAGNWPRVEDPGMILDKIRVDVEVLYPFFTDAEEVAAVYNDIFASKHWWNLFNSTVREGNVIDVRSESHYRFSSFRKLVIASLLANKFYSDDEPFEGVTGVSLDEYRANLRKIKDFLGAALARFRQIWSTRAAAGLVILGDNVTYGKADWGPLEGTNVLQGTISIGYNNAMLEMFASNDEESIVSYAFGAAYCNARGYRYRDIVTDREIVIGAFKEYTGDVHHALRHYANRVGRDALVTALRNASAKPEYELILERLDQSYPKSVRLQTLVQSKVKLETFFDNTYLLDKIVKGEASLMNTAIAVELSRLFGSEIAAEILLNNLEATPGPVEHQRMVLTGALIGSLIKRLVKL